MAARDLVNTKPALVNNLRISGIYFGDRNIGPSENWSVAAQRRNEQTEPMMSEGVGNFASSSAPSLEVEITGNCAGARIAIAGAGGAATFGHIPAYRRLGLEIVAILDLDQAKAKSAMELLGPAAAACRVFSREDEFFSALPDLGVEILDVAIPTPRHSSFLESILSSLKNRCPPLLVQKPLTRTAEESRRVVELADAYKVPVGINLNCRWVPPFRLARRLVHEEALGRVSLVTLTNRGLNRKVPGEWRAKQERLIGYEMAIHHVDLLIWTFGLPRWIFASLAHVAGFGVSGDNAAVITLGFENKIVANLVEDWTCRDKSVWSYHPEAELLVIDGDRATLTATPRYIRVTEDRCQTFRETKSTWFPDAFAGPMAEMLDALRSRRSLDIEASDHLRVLEVLEGAYLSAQSEQAVTFTWER
jgi:predicted dehydrogenase